MGSSVAVRAEETTAEGNQPIMDISDRDRFRLDASFLEQAPKFEKLASSSPGVLAATGDGLPKPSRTRAKAFTGDCGQDCGWKRGEAMLKAPAGPSKSGTISTIGTPRRRAAAGK